MDIGNSSLCNPIDTDPSVNPFLDSRKTWPFIMISAVSAILNILLIYGLHRTSRPFSKPTTLFFLISSTDIMNSILTIVERIPEYMPATSRRGEGFCFFVTFMPAVMWLMFHLQVILLCFLSSIRFISIYKPFAIITTKKLNTSMLTAFTLTFTLNMALFVMKYPNLNKNALILVWIYDITLFMMVFFITIMNILSYTKLTPRMRNNTSTNQSLHQISLAEIPDSKSVLATRTVTFSGEEEFQNKAFPNITDINKEENTPDKISSNSVKDQSKSTITTTTTTSKNDRINDTSRSARAVLNQRKAVVTLLILTTLYWICCTPLLTLFVLWTFHVYLKPHKLLVDFAFSLYFAYAGINSLVYMWRTKKLRKYFGSIVKHTAYEQSDQIQSEM